MGRCDIISLNACSYGWGGRQVRPYLIYLPLLGSTVDHSLLVLAGIVLVLPALSHPVPFDSCLIGGEHNRDRPWLR